MPFKPELDAAIQSASQRENSKHGWGCELAHVGPNRKLVIWSHGGFRETLVVPERAEMSDDEILETYYEDTIAEVHRRRSA